MLTIEQIHDIVMDRGLRVMEETYTERPEVWRSFVPPEAIITPDENTVSDFPFGHREAGTVGIGTMREIREGQRTHVETTVQGQTRRIALRKYGFGIELGRELQKVKNFETVLIGKVINMARSGAQAATRLRNDIIGGLIQKGTLSAGSTTYFDNSYDGNPDPNRGFIYDGKPWFAASGNAHTFVDHTATGSQGVNLLLPGGLSTDTLQAAWVAMTTPNAIDARGKKITGPTVTPRRLLTGASMMQNAKAVTQSVGLPGSANNDPNAYNGLLEPVIWNELTDDSNAWWLLAEDPGIRVFDSGVPMLSTWNDPATGTVFIGCDVYFGAAVVDWRGAISNDKAVS